MDQNPQATSGQTEPPTQGSNARCGECKQLTIDRLLGRKQIDHHPSLEALEQYADLGCDFCQFILECLKSARPPQQTEPSQRRISVRSNDYSYKDWKDTGQSLYASAKKTDEPSPITFIIYRGMYRKLPLSEAHTDEIPYGKEVYETLLVRVGELPSMELNLIVSRGDNIYHDGRDRWPNYYARHRVGRYSIYPDPGSPINLSIARGWLDDCRMGHAECRPVRPPSLPTRVLDVGILEGSHNCRLVETGNKEGNYVALSHCWGAKIKERLTTETLSDFLRCIQIAQLPANFRDAIYVTRQLGMRYLWIDALCILQDSKEDWASESEKMGSIYQDSTLTIFAMTSKGSEEGFLKTTNPQYPNPIALKVSIAANNQTSVLVTGREFWEEDIGTLRRHSALSKRAWAFQEVILSRRSLFFGARQLYWQCHKESDSLEGLYPFPTIYGDEAEVIVPQTHGQPERSDADTRSDFYILASGYNAKSLTYSSDKLPAFSGLAEKFQHAFGGEYLAGLWSNDIGRGLLWFPHESSSSDSVTQPNRLPSWSWASTNKSLDFEMPKPEVFIELHRSDIQLCNPQNRFGQIRSEDDATRPSITIIGMTMPLVRGNRLLKPHDQIPTKLGSVYFDVPEGPEERISDECPAARGDMAIIDGSFILSYLVEKKKEGEGEGEEEEEGARDLYPDLKCNYLALAVSGKLSGDWKSHNWKSVHGLILQESGDAFKRVGIWKVIKGWDWDWTWKGWRRDQVLKLV